MVQFLWGNEVVLLAILYLKNLFFTNPKDIKYQQEETH